MQNLNALFGVAYRKRQRFSVPQLGYLGYHDWHVLDPTLVKRSDFGRYNTASPRYLTSNRVKSSA